MNTAVAPAVPVGPGPRDAQRVRILSPGAHFWTPASALATGLSPPSLLNSLTKFFGSRPVGVLIFWRPTKTYFLLESSQLHLSCTRVAFAPGALSSEDDYTVVRALIEIGTSVLLVSSFILLSVRERHGI